MNERNAGKDVDLLQFLKLNIISILYALLLFISVEFMMNVVSIGNLTSEQATIVNTMTIITFLVVVFGAGLTLIFPIRKWFSNQKIKFWTAVLWMPYFALFVFAFTQSFPLINGPLPENPVILWVLAGTILFYPLYILIVNYFSVR